MLARRFLVSSQAEPVIPCRRWPYRMMSYTNFHDATDNTRIVQESEDGYRVYLEWEEVQRPDLADEVAYRVTCMILNASEIVRLANVARFTFFTADSTAHVCVIRDAVAIRSEIDRRFGTPRDQSTSRRGCSETKT